MIYCNMLVLSLYYYHYIMQYIILKQLAMCVIKHWIYFNIQKSPFLKFKRESFITMVALHKNISRGRLAKQDLDSESAYSIISRLDTISLNHTFTYGLALTEKWLSIPLRSYLTTAKKGATPNNMWSIHVFVLPGKVGLGHLWFVKDVGQRLDFLNQYKKLKPFTSRSYYIDDSQFSLLTTMLLFRSFVSPFALMYCM